MTEVKIATHFQKQDLDWLSHEGIGLATLDLDKVLCDFNELDIYPGAIRQIDRIRDRGTNVAVVTNCNNVERIDAIETMLDAPILYRGLNGMRGKPAPDMLNAAAETVPLGSAGLGTVHFDDQLKAWKSAQDAKFDWFVWSKPNGKLLVDHPGVLAFRAVEVPAGLLAITSLNVMRTVRDIRRGDW